MRSARTGPTPGSASSSAAPAALTSIRNAPPRAPGPASVVSKAGDVPGRAAPPESTGQRLSASPPPPVLQVAHPHGQHGVSQGQDRGGPGGDVAREIPRREDRTGAAGRIVPVLEVSLALARAHRREVRAQRHGEVSLEAGEAELGE